MFCSKESHFARRRHLRIHSTILLFIGSRHPFPLSPASILAINKLMTMETPFTNPQKPQHPKRQRRGPVRSVSPPPPPIPRRCRRPCWPPLSWPSSSSSRSARGLVLIVQVSLQCPCQSVHPRHARRSQGTAGSVSAPFSFIVVLQSILPATEYHPRGANHSELRFPIPS